MVGTVPLIPDTGNRTLEFPDGVPVADTENMTNGNSATLFVLGDGQNDRFEVNHNRAKLFLHGGAGNDRFLLKTFLVLKENPDDPNEITNLANLFGGAGDNRYDYLQNAPVFINGGPGIDTIVVVGTPIGDIFIVTDTYVAGAGRIVNFTNIEAVEVDGAGGADTIYVLSTGAHLRDDDHRRLGRRHDPHRRRRRRRSSSTRRRSPTRRRRSRSRCRRSSSTTPVTLNLDGLTFTRQPVRLASRAAASWSRRQTATSRPGRRHVRSLQGFVSALRAAPAPRRPVRARLELTAVGGVSAAAALRQLLLVPLQPEASRSRSPTSQIQYQFGQLEPRSRLIQPPTIDRRPAAVRAPSRPSLDMIDDPGPPDIRGGDQFETRRRPRDLPQPGGRVGARRSSLRRTVPRMVQAGEIARRAGLPAVTSTPRAARCIVRPLPDPRGRRPRASTRTAMSADGHDQYRRRRDAGHREPRPPPRRRRRHRGNGADALTVLADAGGDST